MLNPNINENSYAEILKLNNDSSFIPEIFPLTRLNNDNTLEFTAIQKDELGQISKRVWVHTPKAYHYSPIKQGLELNGILPSYQDTIERFKKFGISVSPLLFEDIYGYYGNEGESQSRFGLEYPLVAAYSDFFIICKQSIHQFSHFCGLFFATDLFVELAVPTAILLSADNLVTQNENGCQGKLYWLYTELSNAVFERDMSKYENNLQKLLDNFPADLSYIHPIKVSKWS